jgi:hypothetical protein
MFWKPREENVSKCREGTAGSNAGRLGNDRATSQSQLDQARSLAIVPVLVVVEGSLLW